MACELDTQLCIAHGFVRTHKGEWYHLDSFDNICVDNYQGKWAAVGGRLNRYNVQVSELYGTREEAQQVLDTLMLNGVV
jgi:hypothetical protein